MEFIHQRAARADLVASGFEAALSQPAQPPPSRLLVRRWLADCAAERRLVRPSADPEIASRLLALLSAAESDVPGGADPIWNEVVAGVRR